MSGPLLVDLPDLRRDQLRQTFLAPQHEALFRAEQTALASAAIQITALVAFLPISLALLLQIWLSGADPGHPMSWLLLVAALGTWGARRLARRLPQAFQPALVLAFALGCGSVVAIASPLVMLGSAPAEFLLRYGYFGPVLLSALPFLLLRMPWVSGLLVNLVVICGYLLLLVYATDFPLLDLLLHAQNVLVAVIVAGAGGWLLERLARDNFAHRLLLAAQQQQLWLAHQRAERLLLNILPASIAERLKNDESPIADAATVVTVVFADLVGFTPLAARLPAQEVVELLDSIFRRFDDACVQFGLEKIKTIGDAYLAVAGLPKPRVDHALIAARFALALRQATLEVNAARGLQLALRIGIESGPVVAGVIGKEKFSYDLWGDTVNTAARMESHGMAGRIQVAATAAELLAEHFELEPRGCVEVKGKGPLQTWWLLRERGIGSDGEAPGLRNTEDSGVQPITPTAIQTKPATASIPSRISRK